jgi:NDP-sugar pyrophosphorylase family protein
MESKSNTYVIILTAGYATRLKPLSERIPKPLIEINGKPIITQIISNFKEAGFRNFCIVLGYKGELCKKEILRDKEIEPHFIYQKTPTGMADAITLAINFILGKRNSVSHFFITAADIIFPKKEILKMYNLIKYSDVVLSLMKSKDLRIAKGHANVKISKDLYLNEGGNVRKGLKIIDIIEKPKINEIMSDYYSLPLYLTNQKVLNYLKNICISERGEREFQDALKTGLQNNLEIHGINIISSSVTKENIGEFHLTTLRDILKMNIKYLKETKTVTFKGEKKNFIEPSRIGRETDIGKKVILGPFVIIGNECKIGESTHLINTILYKNVTLGKSCTLEWCIVDEGVSLPDNFAAKDSFITRDNKKGLEIISF